MKFPCHGHAYDTTFLVDWILLPIKYSKGIKSNYQYLLHAYNTFDEALKAIIRIIWRPGVFFVTNYDRNNSHSPEKTFRVDTVSDFVLVWGVNVTSWTQQYDYFCLRGCLWYREEEFWNWFLLL